MTTVAQNPEIRQLTKPLESHRPLSTQLQVSARVATPAAAEAVTQAGLCSLDSASAAAPSAEEAVAVVGLATPNAMKPYVNDGCVKSVVLWNPIDLGYAAVYVMRAVVDGEFSPGDTSVMAGRLGELQVVNGSEVLLGPPFVYTIDNINDFDF